MGYYLPTFYHENQPCMQVLNITIDGSYGYVTPRKKVMKLRT